MKRKTKRSLPSLLILCLIHIFVVSFPVAAASRDGIPEIDAVLVLDASNSMRTSDPDKLSAEAMMMFIDMLSVSGDKVGIVSYTSQIEREKALTEINDASDKDALKEFVGQLRYGSWTDVTVGLDEAIRMLDDARDPLHKPFIVLLTDGNNELDPNSSKTPEDAENDTKRIIDDARLRGFPVYTIGLNYDGEINRDYLQNIADSTGGLFFETAAARELPDILTSVFADQMELKVMMSGSFAADGDYEDIDVEIPDPNILEANIIFLSGEPIESVELYDPSGNAVFFDGRDAVYTSSNVYALLKILSPEPGMWRLRVKGADGDDIKISLLYNYAVDISFGVDMQPGSPGDPATARGMVDILENGSPTSNAYYYADSTCEFILTDTVTGTSTLFPATSQNGGTFTADMILPEAREYQITARVEHPNFFRERSMFVTPSASPTPEAATPSPTPVPSSSAVPTPTASAAPSEPASTSETEGMKPTLIVVISLLGFLLLLLAVGIIVGKRKHGKRVFTGRLVIEVTDNYTREKQAPQYRNLIEYGRYTTLLDLLNGNVSPSLGQVVITPSPDAPSHMPQIVVRCANPQIKCRRDFMEHDVKKGVSMSFRTEIILTLDSENKQIKLRYTE